VNRLDHRLADNPIYHTHYLSGIEDPLGPDVSLSNGRLRGGRLILSSRTEPFLAEDDPDIEYSFG
jgi:hypothetical protein